MVGVFSVLPETWCVYSLKCIEGGMIRKGSDMPKHACGVEKYAGDKQSMVLLASLHLV
jgi:hypothetical protein